MHPILVEFPNSSFFIGTYGILIALGLVGAVVLASWQGRRYGIPAETIQDLAFVAVLSGFIGGRLLYILTNFGGFLESPMEYLFSRTGFVFLGGFLFAVPVCIWFVRRKGLNIWLMGDIVMPSLALAHGLGRIGCHLSGCCYGGVCELPIGIRVPAVLWGEEGELWPNAFADQWNEGLLEPGATASLPLWPVQLMEAGALIALCAALVLGRRWLPRVGMVFGAYLVGYAVLRFGLEYLRGDDVRGLYLGGLLSTSQIISIAQAIAGLVILMIQRTAPLASSLERPVDASKDPAPVNGVRVLPKPPR